jgi:hypothetical protein
VNTFMTSSCTLPLKCYTSINVPSSKHLPLLYLVISKKSCNNLISTLIYDYVCIVCVFVHSHFFENPPIYLEEMDPTF